jgi:acyl-CoA dehydrogenase
MTTVADELTAEEFLSGLEQFVDRYVIPLERDHAELFGSPQLRYAPNGGYSAKVVALIKDVRGRSADAGYFTAFCPTDIGGGGLGSELMVRAYERLHHRYGPVYMLPHEVLSHWTSGPSFLCSHLHPVLREQVLDGLMSGRLSTCFGMSEPDAGSDAWRMSTRAEKVDGGWVISGMKQWISNSPYADYVFLFAVTDTELQRQRKGGVSCFLVPMNAPGVSVDSVIRLFGDDGGNEAILSFREVKVADEALVGELGSGFRMAMQGVGIGRTYNAARCVGLARWALEKATEYAKIRVTFGQPIASYQGISFQLAESAMDIHAARLMALDLGARLDRGELAVAEMAMAKAFCVEACYRVYERSMQICGGMGLTSEVGLYRGWHQARILKLADGSSEILRRTVAARLLKGDVRFLPARPSAPSGRAASPRTQCHEEKRPGPQTPY